MLWSEVREAFGGGETREIFFPKGGDDFLVMTDIVCWQEMVGVSVFGEFSYREEKK